MERRPAGRMFRRSFLCVVIYCVLCCEHVLLVNVVFVSLVLTSGVMFLDIVIVQKTNIEYL